jgi:hypothetical protein
MIKVRGWQVSPAELESTLRDHPDIVDAAVIGVTTPISTIGESPRAYIIKVFDSKLNEMDVRTHMSKYLSAYKQLNGGIVFLDAIPRTSTGKIDRKAIKERAHKEIGESKEISINTTVTSAFRMIKNSVQTIPGETVHRPPQTFSGEAVIQQDLNAVSKALETSFPFESKSPSTSDSSNERTSPPSPTVASSVDSDVEEEHKHEEFTAAQSEDTTTAQQTRDVAAPRTNGDAGRCPSHILWLLKYTDILQLTRGCADGGRNQLLRKPSHQRSNVRVRELHWS